MLFCLLFVMRIVKRKKTSWPIMYHSILFLDLCISGNLSFLWIGRGMEWAVTKQCGYIVDHIQTIFKPYQASKHISSHVQQVTI